MIKIASNLVRLMEKLAFTERGGGLATPAASSLFGDKPDSTYRAGAPGTAPRAPVSRPAPAPRPAPAAPAPRPAPAAPAPRPAPAAPSPASGGVPAGAMTGRNAQGREFYIDPNTSKPVYLDGGKSAPTARQQAQAAPPPPRSSAGFNYVNPNSPEGRLAGVQGPAQPPRYVNPNSPEGRLVRDGVLDEDALRRGETRYRTDSNSAYATDPTTGGFTEGGRQAFRDEYRPKLREERERQYQQMVAEDRANNTRYSWDKYRGDSQWDDYSNPNPTALSDADRALLERYNPPPGRSPLFR